MSTETYDIVGRLDLALKSLQADKLTLQAGDSPEALAEINSRIKDVEDARNLLVARAAQRRNDKERRVKWEAILPRCAEARERFEAAARIAKKSSDELLAAEDALVRSLRRSGEHANNPLNPLDYPSEKEKKQWDIRLAALEREVECRKADILRIRAQQGCIGSEYQNTKNVFERLVFEERQLRPPEPPPKLVPIEWRLERDTKLSPGSHEATGL